MSRRVHILRCPDCNDFNVARGRCIKCRRTHRRRYMRAWMSRWRKRNPILAAEQSFLDRQRKIGLPAEVRVRPGYAGALRIVHEWGRV